jgi:hypothetical protein
MDFQGINYDYNDNTYIITNIRPESGAGAVPMAAATAQRVSGAQFSGTKIADADLVDAVNPDDLLAPSKDALV